MVVANTLTADAAQALREEASRRQAVGTFFGHTSYISVICRN